MRELFILNIKRDKCFCDTIHDVRDLLNWIGEEILVNDARVFNSWINDV